MPVDVVTTVAPVASVVKATAARVVTVVLAVPVAVVATTVAATPAVVLPAATTLVLVAMAPPLVVEPLVVPLAARVARTKPSHFASFAAWVNEAKCSAVRPSLLQNTLFI